MNTVHRLEDVFPAWRQRSEPALEKVIERSIQLTGEGAVPIQNAKAEWRQGIINDCLAWMAEREYWCNPSADMDRVHAEVASATIQLPAQFPAYPSEVEEMADSAEPAWALIGAVGSALGSLALSPLTWLWFENRLIGLFAGGVLGAFALVYGLSVLADRPQFQSFLRTTAATASAGLLVGGTWRTLGGRPTGLLSATFCAAGIWVLLAAMRPRRATVKQKTVRQQRLHLTDSLRHEVDLVLAFCWAHPDRLPPIKKITEVDHKEPLASQICAALSDLRADLAEARELNDLRDTLEVLFQRFEDDGYEWRSVPRGAEYEDGMQDVFDTLGIIQPGRPVRTRRAAMLHRGKLIQTGKLRRI